MKKIKKILLGISIAILLSAGALYGMGSLLIWPSRHPVTADLAGLNVETVTIPSLSGSELRGWFIPAKGDTGIVLMHGVRGDRARMLDRARLLSSNGYNVLLFDFQAHGESPGKYITFGYLESRDAQAAVRFMHAQKHLKKVGVLGTSMGAAAILLADGAQADAIVAEASYTDIKQAVENRLRVRLCAPAAYLSPLLLNQLKWRLDIDPQALSPLNHISAIHVPILIIAGEKDRLAPLEGSQELYEHANQPKELWVAKGAGHQDFAHRMGEQYNQKILRFFDSTLH